MMESVSKPGCYGLVLVAFAVAACVHPESRDISDKLKAGCNDEASCAAIVVQAKAAYPKCIASQGDYGCREYDELYRSALENYFDRVLEPRTKQCSALSSRSVPKGDAAWNICLDVNKEIDNFLRGYLAEYKAHASSEIGFHNPDRQQALDYVAGEAKRRTEQAFNVCNTGCSDGGQNACCSVVGKSVDAAVSAGDARKQDGQGNSPCGDCPSDCGAACGVRTPEDTDRAGACLQRCFGKQVACRKKGCAGF